MSGVRAEFSGSASRRVQSALLSTHVEVTLIDLSAGKRDFLAQNGTQPETDAALDLSADLIRIDRQTAIDGSNDPLDLDAVAIGGNLGDLCHNRTETLGDGNAPEAALGQRLLPFGLVRRKPENGRMSK